MKLRDLRWRSLALAAGLCACIIPDEDIDFFDPEQNDHAVRFVDSAPITLADRCECSLRLGLRPCEEVENVEDRGLRCPVARLSRLPQFMDYEAFDAFNFCGCTDGEQDSRALPIIDDLWVEDLDVEDGQPSDSLFAALLLDLPSDPIADGSEYVAYRQLLNPDAPLLVETSTDAVLANHESLVRPEPQLRRVVIGNPATSTADLCNDAGVGGGRLTEGWHTLTLLSRTAPGSPSAVTTRKSRTSSNKACPTSPGTPPGPPGNGPFTAPTSKTAVTVCVRLRADGPRARRLRVGLRS